MAAPFCQLDVRMEDLRRLVDRTRETALTEANGGGEAGKAGAYNVDGSPH